MFFYFLDLSVRAEDGWRQRQEPVIPGEALSPPLAVVQRAVLAVNMNVQSSFGCPALRLLQRAPKVMLGDGFCALFRCCLCRIWQNTQVSGNFRDTKRLGRLMSFPPSEDIQMDLGFKASREISSFENFPGFREKGREWVGPHLEREEFADFL